MGTCRACHRSAAAAVVTPHYCRGRDREGTLGALGGRKCSKSGYGRWSRGCTIQYKFVKLYLEELPLLFRSHGEVSAHRYRRGWCKYLQGGCSLRSWSLGRHLLSGLGRTEQVSESSWILIPKHPSPCTFSRLIPEVILWSPKAPELVLSPRGPSFAPLIKSAHTQDFPGRWLESLSWVPSPPLVPRDSPVSGRAVSAAAASGPACSLREEREAGAGARRPELCCFCGSFASSAKRTQVVGIPPQEAQDFLPSPSY
ncbi:uncharacterized protein LOC129144912 [Talpa occidentalis]|uniref:uncharacterized protein LOC129144912 n=1 Tax=Talpa occidentalis TaxID=50954 RepID=UPI0023F8847A|nr:uncharacterized protein LOC129144912 [Talpa occidentalis]